MPIQLLIYINDLNERISHCSIHHFADDANNIFSSNTLKKINKYSNHSLAQIVQLLRANCISLNSNKTEIIIFRPKNKNKIKKS